MSFTIEHVAPDRPGAGKRSGAAPRRSAGWAGPARATWREHPGLALAAIRRRCSARPPRCSKRPRGRACITSHAGFGLSLQPTLPTGAPRGLAGRDLRERVPGLRHVRAASSDVPAALRRRLRGRARSSPASSRAAPSASPGPRQAGRTRLTNRQAHRPGRGADSHGAGLQRASFPGGIDPSVQLIGPIARDRRAGLRGTRPFLASTLGAFAGAVLRRTVRGHCRGDGALVRRRAANRALPAPAFRGAADRARQHDLEVHDRVDAESVVGRPARPPSGQRRLQRPGAQPADQRPPVVAGRAPLRVGDFSRPAASGPSRRSRRAVWSRSAWHWAPRPSGGCAARRAERSLQG